MVRRRTLVPLVAVAAVLLACGIGTNRVYVDAVDAVGNRSRSNIVTVTGFDYVV